MKRVLPLLPLLLLAGCGSPSQTSPSIAVTPTTVTHVTVITVATITPSPPKVKATMHPDHAEMAQLQPAQGRLAPGVFVYDKEGYLSGCVVKMAPDHTLAHGARGAVLLRWISSPKAPPQYVPLHLFKYFFVLKK